jgi:hypothetical protein
VQEKKKKDCYGGDHLLKQETHLDTFVHFLEKRAALSADLLHITEAI